MKLPILVFLLVVTIATVNPGLLAQGNIIDLQSNPADLTIIGSSGDQNTGAGLALADVNGDGFDDIVIGAPKSTDELGRVYIIYGKDQVTPIIDLGMNQADVTITGCDSLAEFGTSILCEDVNLDRIEDILVAAPLATPGDRTGAGIVYLFFGRQDFPKNINLQQSSAEVIIVGAEAGDHLGTALAAGDVNGDGRPDLLIGADGVDSQQNVTCGATFVIFNKPELLAGEYLDCSTGFAGCMIYGEDANDLFGRAVASVDINGDGIADMIVGAHKADSPVPDVVNDAGAVYILKGNTNLPGVVDLSEASAQVTIFGYERKGWFGFSLCSGDLDNDGYADLFVGAPQMNWQGNTDAGIVYLFSGKNLNQERMIRLENYAPTLEIAASENYANLGWDLTAANFNANELPDLVLGARQASLPDRPGAGMVFIILDVSNLDSFFVIGMQIADIAILGEATSGFLGTRLGTGDFNNDNNLDLILSAPAVDPGGRVYCLLGSTLTKVERPVSQSIVPSQIEVYQNYPNPFGATNQYHDRENSVTTIKYNVFTRCRVRLKIYDITGKEIKSLADRVHHPGVHSLLWDGRDSYGNPMASGVYFLSVSSEQQVNWLRLILIH